MRRSVDLPEPFGPISARRLPASTRTSTDSRIVRAPWWRAMWRASRRGDGMRAPSEGGRGRERRERRWGRPVQAAVSERHACDGPKAAFHGSGASNRRPVRPPPVRRLSSSLRASRRTRCQVMSDLVSKISASGLSAGVFLLWWPAHVTSQGGDVLLARSVLWAAAFEVLLLSSRPLERAVGRAVREREPAALAPSRIGRILVFAVLAAAVPAVLLSGSHDAVSPARAAAPKVIVKREIVRREVVV